ncbi:MAG: ORF6N domain-containing protein [Bacteroidetes bacterium]|nr:ORF6N domain-containing protein [Bacteroidota bacterium]
MEVNNLIYTVRGIHVMLDSDLAELFQVETKVFNQAVKRNINRFPDNFRFQLTKDEYDYLRSHLVTSSSVDLRSQIVTLKNGVVDGDNPENITEDIRTQNVTLEDNRGKHRKYLPYAFTEHGVAMLTGIIRSDIAIEMSIKIMTAFVEMRKFISLNALLINRIDSIETRHLIFQNESNEKFNQLFNALQKEGKTNKENIFFDGQIYDAYSFIINLIEKAKTDIVLIDNYLDKSVLDMLSKKQINVKVRLITNSKTKLLKTDIQKFNQQYPRLSLDYSDKIHDRFLLIDQSELYHIGASLKDLGKKMFAFSLMEDKELITNLLKRL